MVAKKLGYETSDIVSEDTDDGYFLTENTKECFVAQVKSFRFLERLAPALIEIAPYFFENDDAYKNPKAPKEDWAYFWDAVWQMADSFNGSCAWVSPKGNIVDCGFGGHRNVCSRLFHLPEKQVEKTWLKVSAHEYRIVVHEKYLDKPNRRQIQAGWDFVAVHENRRK